MSVYVLLLGINIERHCRRINSLDNPSKQIPFGVNETIAGCENYVNGPLKIMFAKKVNYGTHKEVRKIM